MRIGKEEVLRILEEKGIPYERYDHIPVFTVEEADRVGMPEHMTDTKNLFLRDKKTGKYYLVIMEAHKPLNLKELKGKLGAKALSFASPEELWECLALIPGSVSPFGVLNDKEHRTLVVFDEALREEPHFGAHPNENDCSLLLAVRDVDRLLTEAGSEVLYLPL